jgi:hypothetical protein
MSTYKLGDPLPPVGTRVVHEEHGPATIDRDQVQFEQWFVRFDTPFADGSRMVESAWTYPYHLTPA